MAKEISYPYGEDEYGNLIHAEVAIKGKIYHCPDSHCKSILILNKRGTGPRSKATHFSHKPDTKCDPDRYLHTTFIKLLFALLDSYKSEGKELKVNWKCNACPANYTNFNLLERTATIEEEYYLKVCQPDIALLDAEGKVIAAIEIVNTHKPEEVPLQYYAANGITLVQINLDSMEDLDRVEEKIISPDIVNLCFLPKCPNFVNHEVGRELVVTDMKCRRCDELKPIFHVYANSAFRKTDVTTYATEKEFEEAQSRGVLFDVHTDRSRKKHINFNCQNCIEIKKRKAERYKRSRRRGTRL